MNKNLQYALKITLDEWSKLDDYHKGKNYEKSRNNLETWLNELNTIEQLNNEK